MKNNQRDRRTKPDYQIKIAKERMKILLDKAMEAHAKNPALSRRYFQIAKKIGMRFNVRMPPQAKRKFCKKCFSYLSTGWRFHHGVMHVRCGDCGNIMRYPYKSSGARKKS